MIGRKLVASGNGETESQDPRTRIDKSLGNLGWRTTGSIVARIPVALENGETESQGSRNACG